MAELRDQEASAYRILWKDDSETEYRKPNSAWIQLPPTRTTLGTLPFLPVPQFPHLSKPISLGFLGRNLWYLLVLTADTLSFPILNPPEPLTVDSSASPHPSDTSSPHPQRGQGVYFWDSQYRACYSWDVHYDKGAQITDKKHSLPPWQMQSIFINPRYICICITYMYLFLYLFICNLYCLCLCHLYHCYLYNLYLFHNHLSSHKII